MRSAIVEINAKIKEKFIVLIDEWDLIFRDFRDDFDLQFKFVDLLKNLFKAKNSGSCFALVYMTGILPIKKYYSHSFLNNFKEYNMLRPQKFAKYFGFTDDDVKELLKKYDSELSYKELKEWYDGYKLNGIDIYNPNSIFIAIESNECDTYFSDSASNEDLFDCINMDLDGLKEDVLSLLEGQKIPFNSKEFQNNISEIKTKNDVFCLLICLGYLASENLPNDYEEKFEKFNELTCSLTSKNNKLAFIPNKEVAELIRNKVDSSNWSATKESRKLAINFADALIKDLDEEKTSEIFTQYYHSGKVCVFDKRKEDIFRLAFTNMFNPYTENNYVLRTEDQLGLGRADLVYLPIPGTSVKFYPIIIEFKIDKSTKVAFDQIVAKKYYREYSSLYNDLILVGINYNKDDKICEFKITKYSDLKIDK